MRRQRPPFGLDPLAPLFDDRGLGFLALMIADAALAGDALLHVLRQVFKVVTDLIALGFRFFCTRHRRQGLVVVFLVVVFRLGLCFFLGKHDLDVVVARLGCRLFGPRLLFGLFDLVYHALIVFDPAVFVICKYVFHWRFCHVHFSVGTAITAMSSIPGTVPLAPERGIRRQPAIKKPAVAGLSCRDDSAMREAALSAPKTCNPFLHNPPPY